MRVNNCWEIDVETVQVKNVAIIGAGIMGVGIAQNFAQAGLSVNLLDMNREILAKSVSQIATNLDLFQAYGLLRETQTAILSRIKTFQIDALNQIIPQCQYLVEAVPEILEAKRNLLALIEKASSGVIIASNTSSFTINELNAGMHNPERVVGVHYFNPAHIIPVVEIHRGDKTGQVAVDTARELMLKIGKKPVLVRKTLPGFIVNRLTGALEREIDYLLDQGVVSPEELDVAIKGSIGFRMACLGPQETEDMIGLDTAMLVSRRIYKVLSNSTEPSSQLVEKVQKGELGIKSGKGWYDYKGKTSNEVLNENNKKLLQQLAVFNQREKTPG
jgi:3-hydroxybutyryl-CoA dehydrogenase